MLKMAGFLVMGFGVSMLFVDVIAGNCIILAGSNMCICALMLKDKREG